MTKVIILRNVATIVACLAVSLCFVSCEPADESDPDTGDGDGINMSDKDYYGDKQNALQIALRNVRIKYWVQIPDCDLDPNCDEPKYGEVMICKGRQWFKTNVIGAFGEDVYREGWSAYDIDGILRGYNFIKNEMYTFDWYTTPPPPFDESTGMARETSDMLEQYYGGDSKSNYWDEPFTHWVGDIKISTTFVTKLEKERTVAGRLCNMYTVTETFFSGNSSMDFTVHKVWYDPETSLTMRVEEYDAYGLSYLVEITEIEYGKVTVAQLDEILDNYLKTHKPTDVSDDENPGWNW
jgi:hypothetical protein